MTFESYPRARLRAGLSERISARKLIKSDVFNRAHEAPPLFKQTEINDFNFIDPHNNFIFYFLGLRAPHWLVCHGVKVRRGDC